MSSVPPQRVGEGCRGAIVLLPHPHFNVHDLSHSKITGCALVISLCLPGALESVCVGGGWGGMKRRKRWLYCEGIPISSFANLSHRQPQAFIISVHESPFPMPFFQRRGSSNPHPSSRPGT